MKKIHTFFIFCYLVAIVLLFVNLGGNNHWTAFGDNSLLSTVFAIGFFLSGFIHYKLSLVDFNNVSFLKTFTTLSFINIISAVVITYIMLAVEGFAGLIVIPVALISSLIYLVSLIFGLLSLLKKKKPENN